jgi:hypothetical protein
MLKLIIGLILLIVLLVSAKYVFVENFTSQKKCDMVSLSKVINDGTQPMSNLNLNECCDGLRSGDEDVYRKLHVASGGDSTVPYIPKNNNCIGLSNRNTCESIPSCIYKNNNCENKYCGTELDLGDFDSIDERHDNCEKDLGRLTELKSVNCSNLSSRESCEHTAETPGGTVQLCEYNSDQSRCQKKDPFCGGSDCSDPRCIQVQGNCREKSCDEFDNNEREVFCVDPGADLNSSPEYNADWSICTIHDNKENDCMSQTERVNENSINLCSYQSATGKCHNTEDVDNYCNNGSFSDEQRYRLCDISSYDSSQNDNFNYAHKTLLTYCDNQKRKQKTKTLVDLPCEEYNTLKLPESEYHKDVDAGEVRNTFCNANKNCSLISKDMNVCQEKPDHSVNQCTNSHGNQGDCLSDSHCYWNGEECKQKSCGNIFNDTECGNMSHCKYVTKQALSCENK